MAESYQTQDHLMEALKSNTKVGIRAAGNSVQHDENITEDLTDKTIRSGDKLKVSRVIADMLGVDNAESMPPDTAVNAGLRKIKNKRLTPEFIGTIRKMVKLAQEVGVKIDPSLIPKDVAENRVIRFSEFTATTKPKIASDHDKSDHPDDIPTQVGASLTDPSDDNLRRRKALYKLGEHSADVTEDMHSADYKINPQTGRKYRARHIEFQNSKMDGTPSQNNDIADHTYGDNEGLARKRRKSAPIIVPARSKIREELESDDMSEDDIDQMISHVDDVEDIIDVYDDDEFVIVDQDTGEVVDDVSESVLPLNEVLSRMERVKAKMRFARSASKRERRLQIALKTRSSATKINQRARRLAVNLMKQRIAKKPVAQMTVSEKERAERIIQRRKDAIGRMAMKLAPRLRKIENDRLSHAKVTQ